MKPEQWQAVERLYFDAIELNPGERTAFLARASADREVRREVESLLEHRGPTFIERRGIDLAAEMFTPEQTDTLIGQTMGRYHVMSRVGAGGMGVVYRARDTRLGRDVALKVLPEHFSRDRDRLARFEREARLLASLNHPNIAGIYDLDQFDSIQCLVLEFVEGQTLGVRLARGRITPTDAVRLFRQIAEALDAAHEQGIVHRDLKPANVMTTPNGTVKVLDFGIAELLAPQQSAVTQASSVATLRAAGTGTPSYMSPEQVGGRAADKRTDIWAFGCVLYEALTGQKAFEKETVTATLADIVEGEPDWTALPVGMPPRLEHLLRRCLQKDARQRLRDIGDALDALADDESHPQTHVANAYSRGVPWVFLAASIVTLALVGAPFGPGRQAVPSPESEMRVEVTTPATTDPVSTVVSPDGQTVAAVATDDGRSLLWLRSLGSTSGRFVEGTDGASCPFWSPDGASIGFFADGKLKRVDVDTGSIRILTTALSCGGTWSRDGTILFSSPLFGPISRISATGSADIRVTSTDRPRQTSHRFPQFLPDGRRFLYYVAGTPEARGIYVGDLDGSEPKRLLDADSAAVYSPTGHLLFVRLGTLFAQPFDSAERTLRGNPLPVDEHVVFDPTRYMAAVSASTTGVVVYRAGPAVGRRQFMWLDRGGKEIERIGDPDTAGALDPSLSPDDRRVALYRTVNGRPDIWLVEARHSARSRFTSEEVTSTESGAIRPIWSPDGTHIVFASNRKSVTDLFRRPVIGGPAELLLETDQPKAATDWSRDGRFVLYRSIDPKTGWDVWALPIVQAPGTASRSDPGRPFRVVQTNFDEMDGQFSPDGKWVAYESNETGRFEIYVQPFPGPGSKLPISRNGGAQVRWRSDGRELFYVALDDRLMAVPIRLASNGQSIEIGTPSALFTTRIGGAVQGVNRQQYMVASDGRRFLMNGVVEEPTSPIIVVLNWKAGRP